MLSKSHGTDSWKCLIFGFATIVFTIAPGATSPVGGQSHDDHEHGEDAHDINGEAGEHHGPIMLDEHEIERMGIVVAHVSSGEIRQALRLPGEIRLNEDRVAHIVPRFDGVVREVRKRLGDTVAAGEVMAVIESNTSLQTYDVRSLIAGTVVGKHITLGEFVSTDRDVYVVADLADVWVDIAVYARDQGAVKVGQEVRVHSNDLRIDATAVISYVSPLVDEHTRTSLARAVLPNPHRQWRAGSFVTAVLNTGGIQVAAAVPNNAIETIERHSVVFVQTDGGFSPREVSLGMSNGGMTEIVTGLEPGETIVVEGSFTLKAELMKGSFGDGHAH